MVFFTKQMCQFFPIFSSWAFNLLLFFFIFRCSFISLESVWIIALLYFHMDRLQKLVSEWKKGINYLNSKATPSTRPGIHSLFYFSEYAHLSSLALCPKWCNASNMECWKCDYTFSHSQGGIVFPQKYRFQKEIALSDVNHRKIKISKSFLTPPNIFLLCSLTDTTHLPQFLQSGTNESSYILANSIFLESLHCDFHQIISPSKIVVIPFLFGHVSIGAWEGDPLK